MSLLRVLALSLCLCSFVSAQEPLELSVHPKTVMLSGARDAVQLVVTAKFPDGGLRDVTHAVSVKLDRPEVASVGEGLFLRGAKNGTMLLTLSIGAKSVAVPVTVDKMDAPKQVSFRQDVMASLNVGGCNMGACHGTPSGKNGFKLSLRGFDPKADYLQLTREQFGRRIDIHNPDASLMLLKGLGKVQHEGGSRLGSTAYPTERLRDWLAAGTPDDATNLPTVKALEVTPMVRVQSAPATKQQIAVVAIFSDNSRRDVTRLTNFSSSENLIAEVNLNGLVEFKRPGEVAILARYLETMVSVRLTYLEPRAGFVWAAPPEANFVDKFVFQKLKVMSILPSVLSSDSDFVRRATLDAVGRLPTPDETKTFLADAGYDKRAKYIERITNLPEFADFWAMKWADVLRSSRKTMQVKGSHAFQQWLRDRLLEDTSFDNIARELLTSSGQTYAVPAANFYRTAKDPMSLAETTAQLFLGVRMQCAKCHNHPSEKWSQDDYYGLAAVFARVGRKADPSGAKDTAEVILALRTGEVSQPRTGQVMKPRFPLAGEQNVPEGTDRRAAFADWLTKPGNDFFAKSVANRVWFHLLGRGIVDPVDDFRESNPSSNDELLAALADDFTKQGFRLKALVRTIMNSRTYQLAAEPNASNTEDVKYFSHAATKLLSAEQLLDALCDVTGVPEKFPGLPLGTRAIQLPDTDIAHPFLKTFGQPARELACECERESDGNLAQALQLINGPTINDKVKSAANRLTGLLADKSNEREKLNVLYLTALSRNATNEEAKIALAHVEKRPDKRKAWEDVLWAILNTREFLFRH
jgi:Protein of unknown function (DUF1553)/Protein of unknown function (DUF1549)